MQSLDIEYKSGNLYRYLEVTKEEYDELEAASSKGTYINHIIKKHRYIVIRRQIA
jgi:KTSC domain-containing protein